VKKGNSIIVIAVVILAGLIILFSVNNSTGFFVLGGQPWDIKCVYAGTQTEGHDAANTNPYVKAELALYNTKTGKYTYSSGIFGSKVPISDSCANQLSIKEAYCVKKTDLKGYRKDSIAYKKPTNCISSKCESGACKYSSTECPSEGAKQCSGTTASQVCTNMNGALKWQTTNCASGTSCSNGICKTSSTSTNICTVQGAKQCSGTTAYQTCTNSAWSTATNCASGQTCSGGVCSPSSLNSYNCVGVSDNTICISGYVCYKGICGGCINEGEKRCETYLPQGYDSSLSYYEICTKDANNVLKWSQLTNCASGQRCYNPGLCSATPPCREGTKQCSGTTAYQTCTDGWSTTVTNCASGTTCSNSSSSGIGCY